MPDLYRGPGLPTEALLIPRTVTNRRLIADSIAQILGTRIGERLWVPDFGSRLAELLFEPNDEILIDLARDFAKEALDRWEPRVRFLMVDAVADEHTLRIVYRGEIIKLRIPIEGMFSMKREQTF